MVGIVGSAAPGPTMGDEVGIGTAGVALTPRLPISIEPNGIPVRPTPPGAIGAVDVAADEVGADEDTTLLEPEPHIPDIPAVSSVPEVVETPDVPRTADEVDIPDAPDIAAPPDIDAPAAVLSAPFPIAIPPPSKLAVDPNIDEGEVPTVEHAVPLAVFGIVIVPVTPAGAGLSPGEVISVEPSGIPVGPTNVPGLSPSGEVASTMGVVGIAPTWAMALLQVKSAGSTAAINHNLIGILLSQLDQRDSSIAGLKRDRETRIAAAVRQIVVSSGIGVGDARCRWFSVRTRGGGPAGSVQLNTGLLFGAGLKRSRYVPLDSNRKSACFGFRSQK